VQATLLTTRGRDSVRTSEYSLDGDWPVSSWRLFAAVDAEAQPGDSSVQLHPQYDPAPRDVVVDGLVPVALRGARSAAVAAR